MNDKKTIIAGLTFFVILIAFPFWFRFDRKFTTVEVELSDKAKIAKQCVISDKNMVSQHMQILDLWRHSVVRNASRVFVNSDGLEYNMSITNTCLDCHSNKSEFCDKCHDYASVEPYCWNCHVEGNSKGDAE